MAPTTPPPSEDELLAALAPSADREHPPDDLDAKSEANWARLPEGTRRRCAEELRRSIPPELLAKWRDQLERGVAIGSDDLWFHMGAGMAVRNCLRGVLPDGDLPGVQYENGLGHDVIEYSNWDDYYTAALRQAVESSS